LNENLADKPIVYRKPLRSPCRRLLRQAVNERLMMKYDFAIVLVNAPELTEELAISFLPPDVMMNRRACAVV
jgi:hypothetical protein